MAPSEEQLEPPIIRPEPRRGTKNLSESIFVVEQRQQLLESPVRQSRHNKSSSLHYNLDGPSMRPPRNLRAKSSDSGARTPAVVTATSLAALRAAQLSATVRLHDGRGANHNSGQAHQRKPYLAAASKAWSNSTAKSQIDRTGENRSGIPRIETPVAQASTTTPADHLLRRSMESLKPLQAEFLLPMRSGNRSKSQNSEMIQEVNQYVHADLTHNGPLQAARISFAQDREAHGHDHSPPSRPSSAHPSHALPNLDRQNKSTTSLPWSERQSSPPIARVSTETSRAALSAASLTWASHEHDKSRPTTPAVEPYHYMQHKSYTTLRKTQKEPMKKFWKHGRVQPMSAVDRKRYDGLWAANKGVLFEDVPRYKEDIANIVVREIWERSRLQAEILSDIYDLVDREARGRLSRDEFVVGTWLVDHSLRGHRLPFKPDLTDDLFDGGYMARLGIKVPKKLKHDEKKYLTQTKERHKE